jgi:hypothetical protein
MVHIEEIRVRAYYLWLGEGQPEGSELADWLVAEQTAFATEAVTAVVELDEPAPAEPKPKRKAAKPQAELAEAQAIATAAEPKKAAPKGRKKVAVAV